MASPFQNVGNPSALCFVTRSFQTPTTTTLRWKLEPPSVVSYTTAQGMSRIDLPKCLPVSYRQRADRLHKTRALCERNGAVSRKAFGELHNELVGLRELRK